ncbi:putative polysaccharide biosynthesis protein [Calidifontibacillus erzurumensis]|uniref:Polysaccharide biosynthesis protein n=1 Tax=Calidifontibacillus erzurumensis TaxID=2741433 RepID=A0A8J8GGG4_9BACI|nr:polysaccharide biosynthesis protein [Calidifontibacillus erzurumensis]NSL51343.1 polysaccharide biosynthesis protein [Calidifontibacillus erzurumensis]
MSGSKLIKGTMILTGATLISKILGMIYVFPFYSIVGNIGGALYSYAYIPYTILLSMATMGVPLAVSKFVSKYNALGDYYTGRRLFKTGLLLMFGSGIFFFIILYSIAPWLAPKIIGENEYGIQHKEVVYVIRMVSTALIIVPMMSIIRGFFQGYQSMGPTAVSQVVEQIARIIFLLFSSYIVMKVLDGDLHVAVGLSVFAATIGAIFGMGILIWYWFKRKHHLNELLVNSKQESQLTTKEMLLELLSYAGPFVFVSLAIPLYQLVDEFTFHRAMESIGKGGDVAHELFSILNMYGHKLIMIPVSLATAFGLTLVPTITESFTENNFKQLHKQISQALQVVVFLTLPAVVGLAMVSGPAIGSLYSVNIVQMGEGIIRYYAPIALFFALFTVTSAILQGINQQRFAVYSMFSGLLIKTLLNIPLIQAFETYGAIWATGIGFFISIAINLFVIKKYTRFRFSYTIRRSLLISIFVLVMAVVVQLVLWLLSIFIQYEDGRGQSIVVLIISIAAGAGVYLYLSIKSNLAGFILGYRFKFLQRQKQKANG